MDNRRRGRLALVMLALGIVVTPLTAAMAAITYQNSLIGDDVVPSFALGCGIGMLITGSWLGMTYFTRKDEFFELHEDGLAYVRGKKRRAVRFGEVEVVKDLGRNNAGARMFARLMGGPTAVQLKPRRGQGVVIPPLVKDAESLIAEVRQAVDSVPSRDGSSSGE